MICRHQLYPQNREITEASSTISKQFMKTSEEYHARCYNICQYGILILGIQKQIIPMFFQNCTETITQKIPKKGFELTLTDLKRIHHA